MVELAIILGIFGNLILALGFLGLLLKSLLIFLSTFFLFSITLLFHKRNGLLKIINFLKEIKKDKISVFLFSLSILQILVNLIGAYGPELGFDSLWYHLTLPKIFLENKTIFFIPGNLFYYSSMPKLTEMFYLISLLFSESGSLAKLIHFSFGLLSFVALYSLARKYLSQRLSLLAGLTFYSTLIVGWQSTTAYIDLARTFFEVLALTIFLEWSENGRSQNLLKSAFLFSLAISTKLIAFASLPIFLILIFLKSKNLIPACRQARLAFYFLLLTLLIPLPWFIFSFIHTGNPFYPVFSGILDQSHVLVFPNLILFFRDLFNLLYRPVDPISPVFLIFLPLVLYRIFKGYLKDEKGRVLGIYVLGAIIFWFLTPRTGGSRFILPYLPAISLLTVFVLFKNKKRIEKLFLTIFIFSFLINIGYRSLANRKYIPVILGRQTRDEFLTKNLNFDFGDFYDIGGNIKRLVGENDLVLIYGSHNMFYADFSFVHESYADSKTPFPYVLTQGVLLPESLLEKTTLIYQNSQTKVKLYVYGGTKP